MARIFAFSHPTNIARAYSDLHHVSPTRSFWMAAELAALGHEVVSPVLAHWPPGKPSPCPRWKLVPFEQIPELGDFDLIFCHQFTPSYVPLIDCAFKKKYEKIDIDPKVSSKLASLLETLPVMVQSDHSVGHKMIHADSKLNIFARSRVKAVGLSTSNAKCTLPCESFWCPPAVVPDRPDEPPGEDPYTESREKGRPVAVYLGRLNDHCRPSMSERLDIIAQECPEVDFYIISGKVTGSGLPRIQVVHEGNPGHAERLELVRKIFRAPNVRFLPTPSYDKIFRYLMHADVGIALSVRRDQDIASCKAWEYVSCGVPLVCDDQLPEAFLCREFSLGTPFPFDDYTAAATAIRRVLESGVDRKRLIREMRQRHSYAVRAKTWDTVMSRFGFGR